MDEQSISTRLSALDQSRGSPEDGPEVRAGDQARPFAPTFLYVDDDAFGRDIMALLFKTLKKYPPPTLFADSADFIDRVEALSPQPNVFLLDIQVGPYSGFQMLAMLRAHAAFHDKIIIAVTASVMNEEIALLKRAGFNGAIGKPLDFDNFGSQIASILAGKALWHVL